MPTISKQFSLNNALALAEASSNAYSDEGQIRAAYKNDGTVKAIKYYSADDTQAFLMTCQDCAIVTFRGTQPNRLGDWLTDADVVLEPGPLGMVHKGFHKALNDVWLDILNDVRSPAVKNLPLYFTGHSLGGGLAILATAKMLQMSAPVTGLYTFGQPRAGDGVFANHFNAMFKAQAFRFVNNADIVPRVPPRILNYNHAGTFRFFDKDGKYSDHQGFWQKMIDDVESFTTSAIAQFEVLKVKAPEGIADHAIDQYVARIRKNLASL